MGEIVPDDYPVDLNCPTCFSEKRAEDFGIGWLNTPQFVQADIVDVVKCPGETFEANGSYLLTQTGPCSYQFLNGTHQVEFGFYAPPPNPPNAWLRVIEVSTGKVFFEAFDVACVIEFSSILTLLSCGVNIGGHEGTGEISWGPGIQP